jgi:predicted type IV restriction endonuclease
MIELNLPKYDFKITSIDGSTQIFDVVRKKNVKLTPEEWVRQHLVHFLHQEKGFPLSWMAIEYALEYNRMKKRADILCFKNDGLPFLLVECKSTQVKINQDVFDQIARYNFNLKVPYLMVSNGLEHYCCKMDYENNSYTFIENAPSYY